MFYIINHGFVCFTISISSIAKKELIKLNIHLSQVLSEAFSNKSYVFLTLGFFVWVPCFVCSNTIFLAYLDDLSMPNWIGSWSLALIGLFNVIGTLLFGHLGDSRSKKDLLVILYSLRSILFLTFIFLPKTEITIIIFASLLGILWLSTVPLTSGIISVIFGSKYMSMLYGFAFLSHQDWIIHGILVWRKAI